MENNCDQKRTEAQEGKREGTEAEVLQEGMPKKKGEAQEERKEIARIQLKKEEGSGNQRKLTIIMGLINTHFMKGKNLKKPLPTKKRWIQCPPLQRDEITNAAPSADGGFGQQ